MVVSNLSFFTSAQSLSRPSLDPDLVSVYLRLDLSLFSLKLGTFAVVSMNFSRNNSVILYQDDEKVLSLNSCDEYFYHLLVKFVNGEYTKRCAVSRATTYPKFRLELPTLMVDPGAALKTAAQNFTIVFRNLIFFHRKWLSNNYFM